MSELREWLRKNKLEQYAEAFEANDIDLDILSELTEQDLEKVGVSLGNRRRLVKAIAERAGVESATMPRQVPELQPGVSSEAERRQVTVLFCDLVGSTALSSAIDPEPMGALIRRYQDAAATAIGRFGGFVAKFMGDGVLAYFGFPRAFEDAAERAVRAAIGTLAEVGGIPRPDGTRLQARIGIATGLVVVGEILGTGSAQERSIVGETPNLAARLQSLAAPDTILIGPATRHLLGGVFDLEPIGEQELKGFARRVPVWRVRGEASVASRFAAIRAGSNAPLIGRAHELGLLLDRWRLTCQGEGQIVTIVGEPGIGKSRLIEALQEALIAEPHARVYLQCSPYHSDSALYPVIQHLGRAAGFAATDLPSVRTEKLNVLFAERAASDAAALPLLAELLAIPASATPQFLTPAQRRAATIALLVSEIVRLGETNPVLLVLEDAHWIDATTLEFMTRLADSIGPVRFFAVATARPEFTPPWLARPHATLVTLGRLDRVECAQLVAGVAASRGLSAKTVAAIVDRTDGVPLFVEELTKSMLEAVGEESAAVPPTLKDSLMARLDRLGEAREVAQIASVIGRQFTFALLDAIAPQGGAGLEAALTRLSTAGIVFPDGHGQERSYSFKHALVRDTAYESLLLSRRREWHERVARALEERSPETAADEPDLLAHHFGAAGLGLTACDYRMRAGDQAIRRSAYNEAIAHFSAGLKIAETLPDAADGKRLHLNFLLKLGPALMAVHGMQSAEVEHAYRRAAEIGESLSDVTALYKAKWGLWLNANVRQKTALARDRANELVDLARRSNDGDLLLEGYHCSWSTAFYRGDVAATLNLGRKGVETYDINRHRHLGHAFGGHDPGVCAHSLSAVSLELMSDRELAKESIARALALAEAVDQPNSLAYALYNSAMCYQLVKDGEATFTAAQRAAALAEKFGLLPYRAGSVLLMAWATALGSGVGEAAQVIASEIDKATEAGQFPQYYLGLAGEVLLAAGRSTEGLALLDRAIAAIDEPGVGFYLPEIHRLRGECLLALGRSNMDEARQAFTVARDIATRQGAVIFERRAEASLGEITNIGTPR